MENGAQLGTILVVEDDALLRRMLRRTLTARGWSVVEAADGVEALGVLPTVDVHLVLSDVDMPRMGGRALALALAERRPDLPVVLMSGNPLVDTSDLSPFFIPKPFAPRTLDRTLTEAMAARERSAVG